MNIPLLDLAAQHQPLYDEILTAIRGVLDSNRFILGPEIERLEKRVADYCRCDYGVGVSSGTDALLISLMALDIQAGDEVITSTYSFFATAGVISRMGARPVFVDIDPITYNLDVSQIEGCISRHTKAIIPVHLYGQCADMTPINDLAQKYELRVIEDAAQAIGSDYKDGRRAGSMGELGCFSFFPSKNLGAVGDAGMVVTNDCELAKKVRILRVHGSDPKYYHQLVGGNFRIDEIQAAVLNVKLGYLDQWSAARRANAETYDRLFRQTGLIGDKIQLPAAVYRNSGCSNYHIYNQFILRVSERDRLHDYLSTNHIGNDIYYPLPFHLQECFSDLGYSRGDFPVAESAANETLAIPIYPELADDQQEHIVKLIANFYCGS